MNSIGGLRTALLDLLQRLEGSDVTLIIGGGFGILLKIEHVQKSSARTLLNVWPEPRSTNDIDLFLRPELLINSYKVKPLVDAISDLGYKVVEGAEKYQFVKPGPTGGRAGSLKLDILTGPRSSFAGTGLCTDERRVRPTPSVGLHAHPVDEVPTLEENLFTVSVDGKLSSGEIREDEVLLPHPFSVLMMKLFALHDRLDDKEKDFARYHALDIYAVAAATTENEWESADPLSPGSVYVSSVDDQAKVGLYRLEIGVSPGTGKLKITGGIDGPMKESIRRAFGYLQGYKGSMGIGQAFDTTDFHIEAIDLLTNRTPCEAGVGLVVAIYSALKRHAVQPGLLVIGDLSVQGHIKPARSIAESLQAGMENGAKRALIPLAGCRTWKSVSNFRRVSRLAAQAPRPTSR